MFDKKYVRESLLWIGAFIVVMEGAGWLAGRFAEGSALRLLALVPVTLAIGAGLWVELRQVVRMDELQRMRYLIATLTGSMFAVLFCSVAYVGEALKLWERVAPLYVLLAIMTGFVLGLYGAKRRYG